MESASAVFDWMETLSDTTRVRTLRAIEEHELTVGELSQVLQAPQSTTSHHLKILTERGFLGQRRHGRQRFYRLERGEVDADAWRLWKLIRRQLDAKGAYAADDERLEQIIRERQSQSRAFFASSAGQWDQLRAQLFGSRFEQACLQALLDPSSVVGDLGCGTGRMAELLAPFAEQVHAVDASAAMLKGARARLKRFANVSFHKGQIESLPLPNALLDVALVSLVLHHVAEPALALQEVGRVLKPGARLLLVDMQFHDRAAQSADYAHVWPGFAEQQIASWLAGAGFGAVHTLRLPVDPEAKGPALFVTRARLAVAPGKSPGASLAAKSVGERPELGYCPSAGDEPVPRQPAADPEPE